MSKSPLSEISFFKGLPEKLLSTINASLRSRELTTGEVIFNMGDPGDEMLIVKKGKISIYTPNPGAPESGKPIRLFEPGQFLGEMAIVDQKPRSLSARAEEPSTILCLDGQTFRELIATHPEIASNAMSGLSDRVRYTTDFLNQVRKWVQRITEGNYSAGQFNQEVDSWMKSNNSADKSLITLAAEFAEMVMQVKKREQALQEQIEQLKIEIDQTKRKEEVQQIIGSDYYQNLRARVKKLREDVSHETED